MDIIKLDMQDHYIAGAVWRLQHSAYTIEAALIGFANIPPLMETVATLQESGQSFYGILGDADVRAVVAIEERDKTVTICRLMVHPEHHRQGLGKRLLDYIERIHPGTETFLVSTGSLNMPALRLYESAGFTPQRQWEAAPGLVLTDLVKHVNDECSAT